jgi:hypothetical protein
LNPADTEIVNRETQRMDRDDVEEGERSERLRKLHQKRSNLVPDIGLLIGTPASRSHSFALKSPSVFPKAVLRLLYASWNLTSSITGTARIVEQYGYKSQGSGQ